MEIQETSSIKSYSSSEAYSAPLKESKVTSKVIGKQTTNTTDSEASLVKDTITKDKFADADQTQTGIYSKESISKAMEAVEEQRSQAFISMIEQMFKAQGNSHSISISDINEKIKTTFSNEDIEAAKKSISDEGYYSVDAVATRILDMAKSLAGDDPSKISVLRDAVTKGFGQAAKTLGLKEDDMPDITKSTYTEVMKRFDDWTDSFKTEKDDTTTL